MLTLCTINGFTFKMIFITNLVTKYEKRLLRSLIFCKAAGG